jgi:hypothetical protein
LISRLLVDARRGYPKVRHHQRGQFVGVFRWLHFATHLLPPLDDRDVRTREVRALVEAAAEYPGAARLILTREARTPFPAVAKGIRTLPAWQWMLEE